LQLQHLLFLGCRFGFWLTGLFHPVPELRWSNKFGASIAYAVATRWSSMDCIWTRADILPAGGDAARNIVVAGYEVRPAVRGSPEYRLRDTK
jgi:hypothetical protein